MKKQIEIFRERLKEELSNYKQGNNFKCPIIDEIKVQIMLAEKEVNNESIASLSTQIANNKGIAQMFIKMVYNPSYIRETYLMYKGKKYLGSKKCFGDSIQDTSKIKFYQLFLDLGYDFLKTTNIGKFIFSSEEEGVKSYKNGVSIDKISNNFYTNYRPYGFSGDNKIYSEEKLVNRLNKYLGEDKITHYIYENGTLVFPTWAKLENIDL